MFPLCGFVKAEITLLKAGIIVNFRCLFGTSFSRRIESLFTQLLSLSTIVSENSGGQTPELSQDMRRIGRSCSLTRDFRSKSGKRIKATI
jgi:hypothetical protein